MFGFEKLVSRVSGLFSRQTDRRVGLRGFDKYLIDKEFQYSYILSSLLLLFFVVASTFAVIIIWNKFRFFHGYLVSPPSTDELLVWAQQNNVRTDSMEFACQYIAQAKPYTFYEIIFRPVLVIFLVNVIVITLASLYISYRIAGPLHGLKQALRRKVETGNIDKPLAIRKGDPFHELTSLANLAFFVALHPGIKPKPHEVAEDKKDDEQRI